MEKDRKRILLALDGSEQSANMVTYTAGFLPVDETDVTLLHIKSTLPEAFRDLAVSPASFKEDKSIKEWVEQQERSIEQFMEQGRRTFLDAGFPPGAIRVEVRELKEGFARDIAAEALLGYNAIALGRIGVNPLEEAVLGSIAAKVAIKLCRVPIWLIGGCPSAEKVIVALDSSDSAMLGVDHVGKMLTGGNREVKLMHVVRGLHNSLEGYQQIFLSEYLERLRQEAEDTIRPVFEEALDHLAAFGVPSEQVSTKVVCGVKSRAGAIMKEAVTGGYGTIVTGRRGLTRVSDYDMGRVSYKIVQMARDRAVWIVGC